MWIDIAQNEDEWLDLRAGKVTGSTVGKIMANYGKAFGEPAKNIAARIAIEQLTGKRALSEGFTNSHTERGHANEPIARMLYENEYFTTVQPGGFYDNGKTGCSPDGRVEDNGLIEIKDAIISVHYNRIRKGGFDPVYKWQYLFNLRESGREWLDFVSHCADYPVGKRLYVHRIHTTDFKKEFEMIKIRLEEFFFLVNKIKQTV